MAQIAAPLPHADSSGLPALTLLVILLVSCVAAVVLDEIPHRKGAGGHA